MEDKYDFFINDGKKHLLGICSKMHYSAVSTTYLFQTLRIVEITGGSAEWLIAGTPHIVEKGDLILFNNIASRRISEIRKAPFEYNLYAFAPSVILEDQRFLNLFYNKHQANIIRKNTPHIEECYDVLLKIKTELSSNGGMRREILHNLTRLLFFYSIRAAKTELSGIKPFESKSANTASVIADICNYIQNNTEADLSVATLARRANFSSGHLSKAFKKYCGITLNEYVSQQRVNEVCRLISSGQYNVLDAALKCGFRSSSGFYKTFLRINGVAPRQFCANLN